MQKNPDKIHRNDGAYFRNRSSHPADLDCLKWGNLYVSYGFHVEESNQAMGTQRRSYVSTEEETANLQWHY